MFNFVIPVPSDDRLARMNWKQIIGLVAAVTAVVVIVEAVAGAIANAIVS